MYTANSTQQNKKKTCTQCQNNITAPGTKIPVIFQLEISAYVVKKLEANSTPTEELFLCCLISLHK